MITPEEARTLVAAGEPARKADRDQKFFEDCKRVDSEIRAAAQEGGVAIYLSDLSDPRRLTEYLKQCGFEAFPFSDGKAQVFWHRVVETKK